MKIFVWNTISNQNGTKGGRVDSSFVGGDGAGEWPLQIFSFLHQGYPVRRMGRVSSTQA